MLFNLKVPLVFNAPAVKFKSPTATVKPPLTWVRPVPTVRVLVPVIDVLPFREIAPVPVPKVPNRIQEVP